MERSIIKQWDKNKHKLEAYFKKTRMSEYGYAYEDLMEIIFKICIKGYDIDKMDVFYVGGNVGDVIFKIPKKTKDAETQKYLVTETDYGSCSGCDTLLRIGGYNYGLPTDDQVKGFMSLCLHLVQGMELKEGIIS